MPINVTAHELYAGIFHTSPFAICVMRTLDGKVIDINPSFSQLFGYSHEESVEHDLVDLLADFGLQDQDKAANIIHSYAEVELEFRSKNGALRYLRIWSQPVNIDNITHLVCFFTDFTEHYETQRRLSESENRYRQLVERSPYAIGVHQDGKMAFANPAAAALLGADCAESLVGTPIDTIVWPETWDAARNRIMRMLQGEIGLYPTEDKYRRLDGTAVDVEVTAAPLLYNGRPAVQVIALDITNRKRAQQALFESEERYRLLVNSLVNHAVFSLDKDGVVTTWNTGAERIKGYRADEIIGQNFSRFYIPEEIELDRPSLALKQAVDDGSFSETGWRKRKDGSLFWAQVYIAPIFDHAGKHRGFSKVTQDLTQQKSAEERLRYHANLVESVSDAIISTDSSFQIRSWNSAAEKMYGWKANEVLGRPLADIVPTTYPNSDAETATAQFKKEGKWKGEVIQHTRLQVPIHIMASVSFTYDETGKPNGAVSINRDINEQKAARETAQRLNERLTILRELDKSIIAAISFNEIIETVLHSLKRLTGCLSANFGLIDEAKQEIVLYATNSDGVLLAAGTRTPMFTHPYFEQLSTGNVFLIEDVMQADFPFSAPAQRLIASGVRTILSSPLVVEGKLVGNLSLASKVLGFFNLEHQEMLLEVTNQLSVALQNMQLINQIKEKNTALHNLSAQVVMAQEMERRHIARELHDEIGQTLTALSLMLNMNMHKEQQTKVVPDLAEANDLLNDLTKRVRELSLNLRPSMLDDLGLAPTLIWYFERYRQQTGVSIEFKYNNNDRRYSTAIETTLYRIIQEALTNIARHAKVKTALVLLWEAEDTVHVEIEDNGAGFDLDNVQSTQTTGGVIGLRERAELVGGSLEIDSDIEKGTRVRVAIPIGEFEG